MTEPQPRNALVTGAARRIGRAIALDLASHGWGIAVHHHGSQDEALATVAEIEAGGGRATAIRADLALESETRELIEEAARSIGPLTCLVNNAAQFERDTAETATRASWDQHLETNLRAPFVLMQEFAKAFASHTDKEATGCVINMIDERVWNLTPHFISYTVSKAALWTLTQTLALAFAPRIRVNAIGPGPTLPSPRQDDLQFARQSSATPLGRSTKPEEICDAVRFILAAPAMTGQMIALDGGQHLGWRNSDDDPEE
jgi:NAD(P)-dependent dehydrogenase (short-subunit alcohol dehydrogenase family)